jgi:Predicted transcriptional regulator
MKINLMTDYAMRVIGCIYENEREMVTSNYISEMEKIPHGVLMKVLRKLRDNQIIVSHQGRGQVSGGYSLGRTTDKLFVLNVIEIMEGKIELEKIGKKEIQRDDEFFKEYKRINDVVRREMERYSLYEILERNRDMK